MENEITKFSVYDQKAYLQARLHNKLMRLDELNTSPLSFNIGLQSYNYQIIFQDLCGILLDISSKLANNELKVLFDLKKKLQEKINLPIKIKINKYSQHKMFNSKRWAVINSELFNFRFQIEQAMAKHGFNPDKSDIGSSIVKM